MMVRRGMIGLGVVWCLFAFCVAARAAALPKATINACKTPPKIDGVLDEACWKAAQPLTDFTLFADERKALHGTTAKLAFDRKWLYVGIACDHPAPARTRPKVFDHDGSIGTDESVELFIDPGTDGKLYFHFMLNIANARAEQRVVGEKRNRGWNTPWRSATRIHKTGWSAEIAIPLYVLSSFGDLARARINVTRNAVIPEIDAQAVVVGMDKEMSSWRPVKKSFHEPWNFSALEGLRSANVEMPFLASLANARISAYYVEDGKYYYDVLFDVGGHTATPSKVKLIITDQPVSGTGRTITLEMEIKGRKRRQVKAPVPVSALVARKATVLMEDPATGEPLQIARITDTSILNLMSAYLDRTYYTTEEEATALCTVGMPPEARADARLLVKSAQGKLLGRNRQVQATTRVPVEIGGLPTGIHILTVELQHKSGQPLFTRELSLIKREPRPGLEWKVDKVNGYVLHDGNPFFPFGVVMAYDFMHYPFKAVHEEAFRETAEAGFNTIVRWWWEKPEHTRAYHDMAKRHGLYVVDFIEVFVPPKDGLTQLKGKLVTDIKMSKMSVKEKSRIFGEVFHRNLDKILTGVRNIKDCTNLIAYNFFDEPLPSFRQYEYGRELYGKLNEMDGYHPSMVLYSSWIPPGEQWTDWCDILVTDPYWVPGSTDAKRGSPNYVSKITHITRKRANSVHKATWIVLMAEGYSGSYKRAILPREQRCQTYLALIHGAKGLIYFHYMVKHQATWDTLSRLADEMKLLGPVALTPDIPQNIEYSPGKFDPGKDEFPDIQVCLRKNPAGGYVLLAANSRPYPVSVTYHMPLLGLRGAVARLFSEEQYEVANGSFSDRLEANDTRAYAFRGQAKLTAPVAIKVLMKPEPQAGEQESPRFTLEGRKGRKNIVPNPSFEVASLFGGPDYFGFTYSFPRIGNEGAACGLDTAGPFHGKYCVRVTKNRRRYNGFGFRCAPQNERARRYVFSVYLKGSRDGIKAILAGGGFESKTVELTTSWKRYHVAGTIPARVARHQRFGVTIRDDGIMWADAVQLELGEEPTAFED